MGVFKSVHYWFSLHLIIGKPFSLIYYMINFFLPILFFAEFNNNFNKFFVTSMQLVLISRLVIIAWKWLAILQSTRFHFPLLYFLWPCSSSHWGSLRAKESELVFTTGFGSLRWAKNKLYLLGSWNLVQFKLEFSHEKPHLSQAKKVSQEGNSSVESSVPIYVFLPCKTPV